MNKYLLLLLCLLPELSFSMVSNDSALKLVVLINEYDASLKEPIIKDLLGGIEQEQSMVVNAALFRSLLDLENVDLLKDRLPNEFVPRYYFYKEVIAEVLNKLKSSWHIYVSSDEDFIYLTPPHMHMPHLDNLRSLNDDDFSRGFLAHRNLKRTNYFSQYNVDKLSLFIKDILGDRRAKIFLVGHGFIDENNIVDRDKNFRASNRNLVIKPVFSVNRAAGLSLNEYRQLLKNLSHLPVDFLAVLSCYLGGENLILMHSDEKSNNTNEYPFDLLIFSLGNLPSSKFDLFDFPESKENIKVRPATRVDFKSGIRFDLFFDNLELSANKNLSKAEKESLFNQAILSMHNKELSKDFAQEAKDIATALDGLQIPLQTWPLFKKKGYSFFEALDVESDKVKILTTDRLLKEELRNNTSKNYVEIIDQKAILLYPSVLNKQIRLLNSEVPQVISMIPGDAQHYIESIDASLVTLDELLEKMFLPFNDVGQSNKKSFFIKELICRDNLKKSYFQGKEIYFGEFENTFSMTINDGILKFADVLIEVLSLHEKGFTVKFLLSFKDDKRIAIKSSDGHLHASFENAKQTCLKHWSISSSKDYYYKGIYNMVQSPHVGYANHYRENEKSFIRALLGINLKNEVLKGSAEGIQNDVYSVPPASDPISIKSNDKFNNNLTANDDDPVDVSVHNPNSILSSSPSFPASFDYPVNNDGRNHTQPASTRGNFIKPF